MSVSERPPSTKATMGSNMAHVSARYDQRTSTVISMCALDNLVKGTAGGAIQSLNLMAGWDETTRLASSRSQPLTRRRACPSPMASRRPSRQEL